MMRRYRWVCCLSALIPFVGCDKLPAGAKQKAEDLAGQARQQAVEIAKQQPAPTSQKLSELTDRARKGAEALLQQSSETREAVQVVRQYTTELHAKIAAKDYEGARKVAATIDQFFKSRVFAWYVQLLGIEETRGLSAVYQQIAELRQTENLTEFERQALDQFEAGFKAKGDMRTLDFVCLICALGIELKCGAGGSASMELMQALRQKISPDAVPTMKAPDLPAAGAK